MHGAVLFCERTDPDTASIHELDCDLKFAIPKFTNREFRDVLNVLCRIFRDVLGRRTWEGCGCSIAVDHKLALGPKLAIGALVNSARLRVNPTADE